MTNYANFLTQIKKDYPQAEKHYLKALELAPDDADDNGNYAVFLTQIKKDYPQAEKHHLKALRGLLRHGPYGAGLGFTGNVSPGFCCNKDILRKQKILSITRFSLFSLMKSLLSWNYGFTATPVFIRIIPKARVRLIVCCRMGCSRRDGLLRAY